MKTDKLFIGDILQKHNLTVDLVYDKLMTERIYKAMQEYAEAYHKAKMAEITDKHEIKHGIPFKCPECGEEIQYGLSPKGLKLFANSRLFKDQKSNKTG